MFGSKLPIHQQFMNYAGDNPLTVLAGAGVPVGAAILYKNMKLSHLTLSERIMHSRVFTQAGVVTLALGTFAIRDYMTKHGHFVEPM